MGCADPPPPSLSPHPSLPLSHSPSSHPLSPPPSLPLHPSMSQCAGPNQQGASAAPTTNPLQSSAQGARAVVSPETGQAGSEPCVSAPADASLLLGSIALPLSGTQKQDPGRIPRSPQLPSQQDLRALTASKPSQLAVSVLEKGVLLTCSRLYRVPPPLAAGGGGGLMTPPDLVLQHLLYACSTAVLPLTALTMQLPVVLKVHLGNPSEPPSPQEAACPLISTKRPTAPPFPPTQ